MPSWQWAQPQTERPSLVFSAKATLAVQLLLNVALIHMLAIFCWQRRSCTISHQFHLIARMVHVWHGVTWCDDVAKSSVEALLKWQGTPMTVDHTGSSSCSASHVITFMELLLQVSRLSSKSSHARIVAKREFWRRRRRRREIGHPQTQSHFYK